MSNALAIYQGAQQNLVPFLESMAVPIATLVQCPPEQAKAVMLTCMCEGLTPMDFLRKYHLIKGKPSMRADAMLAAFRKDFEGNYEIIERSSERAAIKFLMDGKEFINSFTWEEAQESRWPWCNHKKREEGLKDNWSTPTDRKAMLWARCVSDGLRAFCPEIVSGIYTPEEVDDMDQPGGSAPAATAPPKSALDLAREASTATATVVETKVVTYPPNQPTHPSTPTLPDDCEVEAEFEEGDASFDVPSIEKAAAETAARSVQPITPRQMGLLGDLIGRLALTQESVDKMLAKREVKVLAELSRGQAHEIIDRLQAKLIDVDPTYVKVYDEDNPEIPFGK